MNSLLYMFVKEEKTEFKIGITDNIEDRYLRLKSVWGDIDLAASCMLRGDRSEVSGLEKTLHFLLNRWQIKKPQNLEGHSEWFSMECFDMAIEIITAAATFRESKSIGQIVYGITLNKPKKEINKIIRKPSKSRDYFFSSLECIQKHWAEYEKATIDFRQHPENDDAWLWTVNINECTVSPFDTMKFNVDSAYIILIDTVSFETDEPSITHMTVQKSSLRIMNNWIAFKSIYEFISFKIENLLKITSVKRNGLA